MTQQRGIEKLLADGSVWRSSALQAAGIRPQAIANALNSGRIARTASGAYYLPGTAPAPGLVGLAAACARMPRAVVCLLSAAHLTALTDAPPPEIWLALPLRTHVAKAGETPQRVLRWSYEGALEVGIVERELCGVRVRHTGPARTIVDLVRYVRHVEGTGPGIRAARRFVSEGGRAEEFLSVAEKLAVPKDTMRTLTMLTLALQDDGS